MPNTAGRFWPRHGEASELEGDRTCLHCGYSLRGLTGDRCPECGTRFERFARGAEGLPWSRRHAIGWLEGFWHTVWLASFQPMKLAEIGLRALELRLEDAKNFRYASVAISSVAMLGVWFMLNPWRLRADQITHATPVAMLLIPAWLFMTSHLPISMFRKQTMASGQYERIVSLSYFVSGCLALAPVHLLAAGLSLASPQLNLQEPMKSLGAGAIIITGAVHLLLWLFDYASMLYRTMAVTASEVLAALIGIIIAWAVWSGILLALIPWALRPIF